MNRYPERQGKQDREDQARHGRVAALRPGATLRLQVLLDTPVLGRALLTKIVDARVEAALVATPQYGRRWYHTEGHAFRVLEVLA